MPTSETPRKESAAGEWRTVTSGSRRQGLVSASPLRVGHRYGALTTVKETEEEHFLAEEVIPVAPTRQAGGSLPRQKKKRQVIVVGNSILRGKEGPICRLDPMVREVSCMAGAKIRDITEAIPALIKPSDYYPMVLVHVGTNNVARMSPDHIMKDFHELGDSLKKTGAQVVFSSILPVGSSQRRQGAHIKEVNRRLQSWCLQESFGFYSHDQHFQGGGFLGDDNLHLSPRGSS
ncbi:uncharacterized protein LOC132247667 [Alligator mississippiensis]|uniref:uncharacterized protein LOC132247667 n=1 Tax=Alligator mississippiensis TaxID=8496 RepID=UPI00287725AF|nr:uncharacterized protein LOC132247667 [Alligator mississippiensis]